MSWKKSACPTLFDVYLSADRRKKLGQLAQLYKTNERDLVRKLIDEDWQRRRPLVEYMKAEMR